MSNNFSSFFCCRCEIAPVEEEAMEGFQKNPNQFGLTDSRLHLIIILQEAQKEIRSVFGF
jgi:hypothetical protein